MIRSVCVAVMAAASLFSLSGCVAPGGKTASAGEQPAAPAASRTEWVLCGSEPVAVETFSEGLRLTLNGQQFNMQSVVAASGEKYAARDDASTTFWRNGDKAMLEVKGAARPECVSVQPDALLKGPEWVIEDINAEGIVDRSRVTIRFGDDGRVTGNASCNNFMGGYSLTKSGLVFTQLATTMMACPPALMDQERKFQVVLGMVTQFVLKPDGALILQTDDKRTITARRG